MTARLPRVAFIGLGNMGQPMALNLRRAGVDLSVWNRNRERAEPLAAEGARVCGSPGEAVSAAGIVATMVADDRALESVVSEGQVLERLPAGAIHVSMSTISVALADRLAADHARAGHLFVSAPVFGRPDAAIAAKLFIVAAGATDALDLCQPFFDVIGQRTFRISETPSAANVVKLSGNFLIASVIQSLSESIALVRKSGIEPQLYVELLTSTLFAAPIYKTYGGLIADRRFRPAGFRMPLGLKDVSLVLEAARAAIVPMPIASVIRDHMLAALAQGYEDADWSALGEIAARNAGMWDS